MWLFLATEVLLFAALFAGYGVYRFLYGDAFRAASRGLETWIGAVNTIVLVTSSFTVAMGLERATRGDGRGTRLLFGVSFLLALVFLGFKYVEYSHHFHAGAAARPLLHRRARAGAGRAASSSRSTSSSPGCTRSTSSSG